MPDDWSRLNERQQAYMQAVFEVDQEQEQQERSAFSRGDRARPVSEWRWMEYGVFDGCPTPLHYKLYSRNLIDEGTGSTFSALENRLLIQCKYTTTRRNGWTKTFEPFLMVQITQTGRRMVRLATGQTREKSLPTGTLREWHWKAMAEAWKARPQGIVSIDGYYGRIGWNTWLRLRDYKMKGKERPLVEEYHVFGRYLAHASYTEEIYWIRLTSYGEQYYRDNYQRYKEMYPDVDAPEPEEKEKNQ